MSGTVSRNGWKCGRMERRQVLPTYCCLYGFLLNSYKTVFLFALTGEDIIWSALTFSHSRDVKCFGQFLPTNKLHFIKFKVGGHRNALFTKVFFVAINNFPLLNKAVASSNMKLKHDVLLYKRSLGFTERYHVLDQYWSDIDVVW